MPPKIKIERETIVQVAVELVRAKGESALNARSLAKALNCSTQPIFSNFKGMEEIKNEVLKIAKKRYAEITEKLISEGKYPVYKCTGMAYVLFASTERELFKLLYMRQRSKEEYAEGEEQLKPLIEMLQNSLNLSEEEAKLFHLEVWAFVHGIATLSVTSYLDLDIELISKMITDIYDGLKRKFTEKE